MFLSVLTIVFSVAKAQDFKLEVWPDGAPNHNGMDKPEETYNVTHVRNVSEAEMYVYLPEKEKNTGAAVVICPGGGYWVEAMGHEGYDIAEWLKERGIAGIVLKYRLPYGHHEIPSGDVRQTMRIVRKNASKWGIDPLKVGIAGSSAGGHLAATAGTRFDYGNPASENPLKKSAADLILCFCSIRLFHSGRSSDTWAQEKSHWRGQRLETCGAVFQRTACYSRHSANLSGSCR